MLDEDSFHTEARQSIDAHHVHRICITPSRPHVQEISLQPLDDDCRMLGSLLDQCLKHEIGDELFSKVRIAACVLMLSCVHATNQGFVRPPFASCRLRRSGR